MLCYVIKEGRKKIIIIIHHVTLITWRRITCEGRKEGMNEGRKIGEKIIVIMHSRVGEIIT